MQLIKRFWTEEDGAEVGEWALFFALLAIVAIAATTALNPELANAFTTLGQKVETQASNVNPVVP